MNIEKNIEFRINNEIFSILGHKEHTNLKIRINRIYFNLFIKYMFINNQYLHLN